MDSLLWVLWYMLVMATISLLLSLNLVALVGLAIVRCSSLSTVTCQVLLLRENLIDCVVDFVYYRCDFHPLMGGGVYVGAQVAAGVAIQPFFVVAVLALLVQLFM